MASRVYNKDRIRLDADLWNVEPAEKPPLVPSTFDDEFLMGVLDTKWAWSNQGSATIAVQNGYAQMTIPSAAGLNLRVLQQAAPSGDFTLTCKFGYMSKHATDAQRTGVALVASGSGKLEIYAQNISSIGGDATFRYQRWNSPTSFSADVGSQLNLNGWVPMFGFVQIKVVGTAITVSFSADGIDWTQYTTSDITTFLGANRAALDKIGFFSANEGSGQQNQASFYYFRIS